MSYLEIVTYRNAMTLEREAKLCTGTVRADWFVATPLLFRRLLAEVFDANPTFY